ncbi:MAG TPA: hypothetical protein DD827_01495 [Gammaproteobacteria bacterium]|jgi:phospholipid transport system substrate-binding protein|nr:hypothetical protein [Gammaproteobacteria bacterium]
MLQKILLSFIVFIFTASPVFAAQSPTVMLQEATDEALAELKKDDGAIRKDIDKLYDLVERLVFPLVDFEAMGKLILGKHWKKATEAQQKDFLAAFSNLLKYTYTTSLKDFANQTIRYFPNKTQIKKDKYATVYSEFVPGNGQANVPVIYKLRKSEDGSWKAYNLVIENLSVVKNYRTDFNREITATSLDSLIARLQKDQASKKVKAERGE